MNLDRYRGDWKIIGVMKDAVRGHRGLTGAGDADAEEHMMQFPADIIFTERGVLVVHKGDELSRENYLAMQTRISNDAGALSPEHVQQAKEGQLYGEVKDVRISGGKQPSGLMGKLAGDKPVTRVWLTRSGFLGMPVTTIEFYAKLPIEEVEAFFKRTPLASKIRR